MGKPAVDISHLSHEEKLSLLDELWAELDRDPAAVPLTDGQRRELDERLDSLDREDVSGVTWEEAVKQIRSR
ncbi:MAG: hypothetical protein JWO36_6982 [Myxococcales bacterium]|nr:hypothetical protein [Myxococcales bacterium]